MTTTAELVADHVDAPHPLDECRECVRNATSALIYARATGSVGATYGEERDGVARHRVTVTLDGLDRAARDLLEDRLDELARRLDG